MNKYSIRIAQPEDAGDLIRMAKELVTYSYASDTIFTNEREVAENVSTWVHCIVLEHKTTGQSKKMVGYALWTYGFSTSIGKIAQLGSLYLIPEHRGRALGYTLFQWVAKFCYSKGCNRLHVAVQGRNKLGKNFYEKVKVVNMTENDQWELYQIKEKNFINLAKSTPAISCSSKL